MSLASPFVIALVPRPGHSQHSHYKFTSCSTFCLSIICTECIYHVSAILAARLILAVKLSGDDVNVCMQFAGVQPVALNLSQSARGRVPVLPYVVPTNLSVQSSASTAPAKQGIKCHLYSLDSLHCCCGNFINYIRSHRLSRETSFCCCMRPVMSVKSSGFL